MRTAFTIFSITILVGIVAGLALPTVRAQGETDTITFHVLALGDGSENLETIPADAANEIVITGTYLATTSHGPIALIQNLCDIPTGTETPTATSTSTPTATPTGSVTPTPACTPMDIYYTVVWSVAWENVYYTDTVGSCCKYTDKDLAPWLEYTYGGNNNMLSGASEKLGVPNVRTGSGVKSLSGTIPAADITNWYSGAAGPDNFYSEKFDLIIQDDWGGNQATVTYTITLSTSPIVTETAPCAGQYLTGEQLGWFDVSSTDYVGTNMMAALHVSAPQPNSWYKLVVTGSWKDNGAGPDLKTMGMKVTTTGTWFPLDSDPLTGCADNENAIYYIQSGPTAWVPYLRVYDTGGNFPANTGTLRVTVYAVTTYTRYQSGCELQYQVGDLIEQKTVSGNWAHGLPLEHPIYNMAVGGGAGIPTPRTYYMLEITGGPANLGAEGYTYDGDIGERPTSSELDPTNWYDAQTAPFVECVVPTDQLGHVNIYFLMDNQTGAYEFTRHYYAFRVRDTGSYADNSGSLTYRLYQATFMQTVLPGDTLTATGCAAYGHDVTATGSIVIDGDAQNGAIFPTLASNSKYALQVVNGPWTDNGTGKYTIELSDDNGNTWTDLQDYPNLLCAASDDGDHVIIYIKSAAGKIWRARANDGDSNFGNNGASIGLTVYPATSSIDMFPTCEDNYTLTQIPLGDEVRKVPGESASGMSLPNIIQGKTYSISITGDHKWYDAGTGNGSYLVDISDDGGTTWESLEGYTHKLCSQTLGDGGRYQLFFTAQSNNYKLRVRDGDGNFLTNIGYVLFDLYSGINTANPAPGGTIGTPPPEWIVACNEAYERPGSFITLVPIGPIDLITFEFSFNVPVPRVGEWIDYLRNAITYYFAWCPEHTAALKSLGNVYLMNREPMKTIVDLMNFYKNIQSIISAMSATGGTDASVTSQEPPMFSDAASFDASGGAGPINSGPPIDGWSMFIVQYIDPAQNVWYGGRIDMAASLGSTDTSTKAAFVATCSSQFYNLFGIGSNAACQFLWTIRYNKISMLFLLGMDILITMYMVFKFLPAWVKKFWNLITGNKNVISKIGGG